MKRKIAGRHKLGGMLGRLRYSVEDYFTQIQLGKSVGVSDTTVRNWENGTSIPKPKHLKELISVFFLRGAFTRGRELEEAEELWQEAGFSATFDTKWFQSLKGQQLTTPRNEAPQDTVVTSVPSQLLHQNTQYAFFFNIPRPPEPKEFFGREQDCHTLLDRASKGGCTSLVGPRRIGKTWLIHHFIQIVPSSLGLQFRTAYINATQASCETESGFVKNVMRELGVAPLPQENVNLAQLEQLVIDLGKERQHVVLCIDEFEVFADPQSFPDAFFAGLRAMNSLEIGLVLITASKMPLKDVIGDRGKGSGFFNIFEERQLKPFHLREAQAFIRVKSIEAGFSQQEQAIFLKYAKENDAWPPLRLQLAGKLLQDDKIQAQKDPEHYYRVDESDYLQYFEQQLNITYLRVMKK
jgi:DNA-binding XRE family transcriptional regulator